MSTQADTTRALEDLATLAELVARGEDTTAHLGRCALRYRSTPIGARLEAATGRKVHGS